MRTKSDEPPPLDYVQAKDIIDRMSDTQRKLDSIEDLLTTSQLCDEEYQQNVKCTWGDASGTEDYTFTLSSTSNHFTEMAIEERERLRKDLLSDIDRLCELRRYGVTQSVTLTDEKTAGERPEPESGEGSENTEGERSDEPEREYSLQWWNPKL
ncbi:MAG: hypothetical protein LIO40_06135 [Ruminococcus sp.]|nr:hypothetical protein [Ruminococcus sp.]